MTSNGLRETAFLGEGVRNLAGNVFAWVEGLYRSYFDRRECIGIRCCAFPIASESTSAPNSSTAIGPSAMY